MILCKRCNKKISKARLKILPETNLCVKCSKVVGGDFEVDVVEENLGNSIVSKPMLHKTPRYIEPLEEKNEKEKE